MTGYDVKAEAKLTIEHQVSWMVADERRQLLKAIEKHLQAAFDGWKFIIEFSQLFPDIMIIIYTEQNKFRFF